MKSPENLIITIKLGSDSYDMEVPAFLPVKDLSEKVAETLRCMDPKTYGRIRRLLMLSGGKELPGDKSLAACGVWDGSILKAEVRE